MRKLTISLAVASALGLTACGDSTTLADVQEENSQQLANNNATAAAIASQIKVVWDPSNSVLSVPNDLVFSSTDFTLGVETFNDDGSVDWSNPTNALGALDGWGLQNPFTIALDYSPTSFEIDADTLAQGVAIYEVKSIPNFSDPNCLDTSRAAQLCSADGQLTYGVDFVAQMSGNNIAIIPLKPYKANTTYAVALTKDIKDTNGNSLGPSSTWASVEQDINTAPIVHPDLDASELNATQAGIRLLQTLVNNYEDTLEELGQPSDNVVYTQVFTTQSAGVAASDPLQITKLFNAQTLAAKQAADPSSVVTPIAQATTDVTDSEGNVIVENFPVSVAMALASRGLISSDPTDPSYLLFSSAKLYGSNIEVPYYLDINNPLTGRWEAACDSVITMAGATPEQLAAATPGENHALCQQVPTPTGTFTDLGIDTARHLTKYNPVPDTKSVETIPVQITVPDVTAANTIRPLLGMAADLEKPATGWPVVIMQHGITSQKEDMLALTGILAASGYATVAIDHPLHGERKVVLGEGENQVVVSATETSSTHYLNLSSLLTARDNLRQSAADSLKLRLDVNTMVDFSNPAAPDLNVFDGTNVYYIGHSLGAITGTPMSAVANTPANTGDAATDGLVNALYNIKATVLSNPGSSIGNFLLESQNFSPLIKASVTYGLGNELSALIQANIDNLTTVVGTNLGSEMPSTYCSAVATAVGSGSAPSQTDALVCAFEEFLRNADATQVATMNAGLTQFAFAAQAVIEAGDPTNYSGLLNATGTPVLMFETVGDGLLNPSDTVIPNSVSTDPLMQIAGTEGLANQLGLEGIGNTVVSETGVKGIARFKFGSHGSLLTPNAGALTGVENYSQMFGLVTQEHQSMLVSFFASQGKAVQVSAAALSNCVLQDAICE
jgi:Pla-1/cef family extracellular lipase